MKNFKSIAIEGSDGAGKATATSFLKDYLIGLNKKVATLSFPRYQETSGGKICREVLKSERKEDYDFISLPPKVASLLYVMDRAESKNYILNLLKENDYLIFDRYVESNFIHQGGKISDEEERKNLISFLSDLEYVHFGLPKPEITFFLYLPTEVAIKNKENQRLNNQNVQMDAGEDDYTYLENSNQSGLWCVAEYGWHLIECFDFKEGVQKSKNQILLEILRVLEF